jgi:uncharacterized protein YijF (DUF1287 family)
MTIDSNNSMNIKGFVGQIASLAIFSGSSGYPNRYQRPTGREVNCVGYWPFLPVPTATVLRDVSNNANNGTISGGLWTRGGSVLFPANIPDAEIQELWKLYSLGGGSNWTNKTNWFSNPDVSTWYGITLSGGRVQKIELPSNNGAGNISSFNPSVFTSMTVLSLHTNSFTGDLSSWVLPANMTHLYLSTNSFTGDLSGWVLPANMTQLSLSTNSFTGDLSSWVLPANMTHLSLFANSFSGDLSSWVLPANMTHLSLYTNSFTGTPDISGNTAMREYRYYSNGLLTTNVDAIINGIWNRRMAFTYTTPIILQIHGTNQAVTGIEQNICPPTTPKEKIYQLENDGCAEGFKKWNITNN